MNITGKLDKIEKVLREQSEQLIPRFFESYEDYTNAMNAGTISSNELPIIADYGIDVD